MRILQNDFVILEKKWRTMQGIGLTIYQEIRTTDVQFFEGICTSDIRFLKVDAHQTYGFREQAHISHTVLRRDSC